MKYWVTSTVPLRPFPGSYQKIMDIPQYSVVDNTDPTIVKTDYGSFKIDWIKVSYREFTGWAYIGRLEFYRELQDVVVREIPAPDHKPHQNIVWEGREKFNLCGQFCVAYIAQEKSIEEFLRKWKGEDSATFNRILPGDRLTGSPDLTSMATVYDFNVNFYSVMNDVVLGRVLFTPCRLEKLVSRNSFPILGVKIDKNTGNIQSSGIGHWVVITDILPYGINRAVVTVYNPYVNQLQTYSWKEIENSIGYAPQGIIVKTSGG